MLNTISNKKNLLGLIVVIIVGIIVSIWAYYYLVIPRDVFYWDESHHAYFGLLIFDSIKRLDWGTFWFHTARQTLWPPLHSWFLALTFLLSGPSYLSARAFSLFPFFGSLILVYLISLRISRDRGWLIGILSVIFMSTSAAMLDIATSCMIESISLFIALAVIYAYLIACEKKLLLNFVWVGLLLGILVVAKYQYAILLGGALSVLALLELILEKKFFVKHLVVLLSSLPVLGLWFFTPPADKKIGMLFWSWKEAAWAAGRKVPLPEKILSYPKFIFDYYSFSYILGAFLFLSLIYVAVYYLKKENYRILWMMVVVPLVMSTIIRHHEVRYICILVPLMYVLAAFMLINLSQRFKRFGAAIIVLLIVQGLFLFPAKAQKYVYDQYSVTKGANLEDVLDYFYSAIPPQSSVSWGFQGHYFTPYTLMFHFYDRFEGYSPFMMRDRRFFTSKYFLTIEINNKFPYYWEFKFEDRLGQLARWNDFLSNAYRDKKLVLYEKKAFPNLHLTAVIYKNNLYK